MTLPALRSYGTAARTGQEASAAASVPRVYRIGLKLLAALALLLVLMIFSGSKVDFVYQGF
jgi:hypothetical protein